MLSTGNDIVSVNAINVTRTKQPNFYSKILTPTETALHHEPCFANIPFEIFVWLLWSIKESAFKYLQRIDTEIIFTPVKFVVSEIQIPTGLQIQTFNIKELTGIGFDNIKTVKTTISFGDYVLYSNSLIYQEFISTVVNGIEDFSKTHWGIKQIDSDDAPIQSAAVRKFFTDHFDDPDVIISKKTRDIPILVKNDIELNMPVSLSHHDKFISYSFVSQ